MHVELLML